MILNYRLILIFVFISCTVAAAQEIDIPRNRGARNAAMGNANISEANDVSTMYLNPASLVFLREPSVLFNHGRLRNEFGMTENIAVPVVLQHNSFVIAAAIETYHLGYLQEHPELPRQQILEYSYSASAAYAILPTFSVGVTAGFRNSETSLSKTWGPFYAVGINYSPSTDINYGLALHGLGDDIRYSIEDSIVFADRITQDKRLVLGASMKYPSTSSLRRTIFVLSLANEKIFGMDGLFYKIGLELRPFKYFNFRLGYNIGPRVKEPRIGAGINIDVFILEYTVYLGPSSDMFEQISFAVKF